MISYLRLKKTLAVDRAKQKQEMMRTRSIIKTLVQKKNASSVKMKSADIEKRPHTRKTKLTLMPQNILKSHAPNVASSCHSSRVRIRLSVLFAIAL